MQNRRKKVPQTLTEMALEALREAVHETIEDHARTGDPIVVYQNGRVSRVLIRPQSKEKIRKKP